MTVVIVYTNFSPEEEGLYAVHDLKHMVAGVVTDTADHLPITLDTLVRCLPVSIGLISDIQSICDAGKHMRTTSNKFLGSRQKYINNSNPAGIIIINGRHLI